MKPLLLALFLVALALAGNVMLSVALAGRPKRCTTTPDVADGPDVVCECFVWDGGRP